MLPTVPGIYTFEATYNGATCSQNFEIINLASGIPQIRSEISGMLIAPNPAQSDFKIELAATVENATLEIYNLNGQRVKSIHGLSGQSFQVQRDGLPSGVYCARLMVEGIVLDSKRLVISR